MLNYGIQLNFLYFYINMFMTNYALWH